MAPGYIAKLGDVVVLDGRQWVFWSRSDDGTMVLAQVPAGETLATMGRVWEVTAQPQRIVLPLHRA